MLISVLGYAYLEGRRLLPTVYGCNYRSGDHALSIILGEIQARGDLGVKRDSGSTPNSLAE